MAKTTTCRNLIVAFMLAMGFQVSIAQTPFWTETFSDQAVATTQWQHTGTNASPLGLTWTWTNVLNAGNWQPGNFNAPSGSTGYFWFDSDGNGNGAHDVRLTGVGNPANCSGKTGVHLKFFTYYRTFSGGDVASVGISTDGTNFTYHNVAQFDNLVAETAGNPQVYQGYIDLVIPEADNAATVWVQFRYEGDFEYYWKVDDLEMYVPAGAIPCPANPNKIVCDYFDTYSTSLRLAQQNSTVWSTWSGGGFGGAEDGIVSTEQANSAPNSMKIVSTSANGGPQDVVLKLLNKSTGRYELQWMCYIPTGKQGYYNLQEIVPIPANNPNGNWNLDVFFNAANAGVMRVEGVDVATFTYPSAEWFQVKHEIDLDNNFITMWIDGQFVKKTIFDGNLGGIDFFGINNLSQFYIDDVEYVQLPSITYDVNICDVAVDISNYFAGPLGVPQTTGIYDNTTATVSPTDPFASCWFETGLDNTVWFTFTGDGNMFHIETNNCTSTNYITDGDTQIGIYTGDNCSSLTMVACNDDILPDTDPNFVDFRAGLDIETVAGQTYYMMIDGFNGVVGEFCIEITPLASVGCDDGVVGTYAQSSPILCWESLSGDLFEVDASTFVLPNGGEAAGMAWAISAQPLDPALYPADDPNYLGSFGLGTSVYEPNVANDNSSFMQAGFIYYFTPVVIGGGTRIDPAMGYFLHNIDVSNGCYFVGQSAPVIFLPLTNPIFADAVVVDNSIDLTPGGGIGEAIGGIEDFYTYEWSNGETTQDLFNVPPGTYTCIVSDQCSDPAVVTVSITSTKDPSSISSLTVSPNPSTGVVNMNLALEASADVRVEVLNTLGQTLQSINAGNLSQLKQDIDFSSAPQGSYFLRVTIDNETAIRHIVIQR